MAKSKLKKGESYPEVTHKFTVNRAKWMRGRYRKVEINPSLRDTEGNQCCLGFLCESLGVPEGELVGIDMPYEITDSSPLGEHADWLTDDMEYGEDAYGVESWNAEEFAGTNDANITASANESVLYHQFRRRGVEVTFEGKGAPSIKSIIKGAKK